MLTWYFTFGYGQIPNERYYIKIRAKDYSHARSKMVKRFGTIWAFQYRTAKEAGIKEWNMKQHYGEAPPERWQSPEREAMRTNDV